MTEKASAKNSWLGYRSVGFYDTDFNKMANILCGLPILSLEIHLFHIAYWPEILGTNGLDLSEVVCAFLEKENAGINSKY